MLIHEYQKSWAKSFIKIKEVIKTTIPNIVLEVEHIGSTSVKYLAAKPIIDIDLIYFHSKSFEKVKEGLENIGYYHNGNQGIEGREVFKRDKLKQNHPILDSIYHHLYVCHINNEELRRHLIFRDFLRANDNKRIEYEKLKISIAERANQDKKEYARLKEEMAREFIESIISRSTKN